MHALLFACEHAIIVPHLSTRYSLQQLGNLCANGPAFGRRLLSFTESANLCHYTFVHNFGSVVD